MISKNKNLWGCDDDGRGTNVMFRGASSCIEFDATTTNASVKLDCGFLGIESTFVFRLDQMKWICKNTLFRMLLR